MNGLKRGSVKDTHRAEEKKTENLSKLITSEIFFRFLFYNISQFVILYMGTHVQ